MKKLFPLILLAGALAACRPARPAQAPYLDPSAPLEQRVEDALARLTLDEKITLLHAQSKFSSAGVKRLGIPELWTDDGPHGVRPEVFWDQWDAAGWTSDSCTAFPALTCLAATWNPDMAALYGKSLGEEARYREKDVLLGPGVNIYRTPFGGRNFEYMGEDPFLASRMVVPYVRELQKNGVAACVKHFALNNEETHRHTIDVDVDERALYEIYLPAFKAAVVEGGAWSVMASYNLFRGVHACENDYLLNRILKGEWGFDGAVLSDWGGVHGTDGAALGGLDLEFGTHTDGLAKDYNAYEDYFLARPYKEKLLRGELPMEGLDDKVRRVLRLNFRTAMNPDKPFGSLCSDAHREAARKIAADGMVLLKNEGGLLPLAGVKSIAVIGENAVKMMTIGGGSSSLKAQYEILPLEGIEERAARDGARVRFARGYVGQVLNIYNNIRVKRDLSDDRPASVLLAEAVEAASAADVAIVVGGLNKAPGQDAEGSDRQQYNLPYDQDALIEAVVAANPHTVVVLVSGNAVAMPWLDRVPAVLQAWYGGSEAGHALADVLWGDVCPSGKLPFTFPVAIGDSPAHQEGLQFPGDGPTRYGEGIFVGYRWFGHKGIKPLFAFGHGLSYTRFEYGEPSLSRARIKADGRVTVRVPVTNAGPVAGAEVVQVYVHRSEGVVERPDQELKGFCKLYLQPGETRTAEIGLGPEAFAWFDAASHAWKTEAGAYEIRIGSASDDIRGCRTLTVR